MALTFGDWLREKIKEVRISNAEVARRSHVSATYIGNLIQNDRRPTVEVVDAIGKALGVPVGEARLAAGYAAPIQEPRTVKELVERLWEIGIQINFGDDLISDDSPEALERAKASIAAILQAQFGPIRK